jgi:pimeloyl-ACP methyl ester carboxylesterase
VNEISNADERYLHVALQAAKAARDFLGWLERASEQLAPERLSHLAAEARDHYSTSLEQCASALEAASVPGELRPFAERLQDTFEHARTACTLFGRIEEVAPFEQISTVLSALHRGARAQEGFYLLRRTLPPFADYWQMPGTSTRDDPPPVDTDGRASTGIIHVSAGGHHGGFSFYVPENYDAERRWPLIVALHGGSGNGRDFLWTWVREAKSYGYLLVAPTAAGDTWGAVDDTGILEILAWMQGRYHLAPDRILLTGLSDGATFGLLYGLAHPRVYRAIAPLCGVSSGDEEGAQTLLKQFVSPDADHVALTRSLRPSSADYKSLFDASTAPKVEAAQAKDWDAGNAVIKPKPGQTEVKVWSASGADLAAGKGNAKEFPGGYKKVAKHLAADVMFFRFKFVEAGKDIGTAYDGLAFVNGHWVIAPKPWRAIDGGNAEKDEEEGATDAPTPKKPKPKPKKRKK